jgi:Flp pilus assembly protein TadG
MISCKRIAGQAEGAEIAEAALVLPIFFMVLLGIYWFGMAFNTYATINRAAVAGARLAATQTCSTCATANIPPSPANVVSTVTQVMQASSVNPNNIVTYAPAYAYCATGGPNYCNATNNNVTVCNNIQLSPVASPGAPACGVSVSFQYPYKFFLPFTSLNMQTVTMSAQAQMKGEF